MTISYIQWYLQNCGYYYGDGDIRVAPTKEGEVSFTISFEEEGRDIGVADVAQVAMCTIWEANEHPNFPYEEDDDGGAENEVYFSWSKAQLVNGVVVFCGIKYVEPVAYCKECKSAMWVAEMCYTCSSDQCDDDDDQDE
jgi:hypothetical protein